MKRVKLSILFIAILFTLSGCKITKNQSAKFEKKDKAPNYLRDISGELQDTLKNIEKIEKILDGTYVEEKPKENNHKHQESTGEKGKEQGQNQNSSNEKSGGQQGQGNSEGGSSKEDVNKESTKNKEQDKKEKDKEELLKNWQEIDKKIEDIHKNWNDYEPEGIKKGATTEKTDSFRSSLNLLTKSVEERNIRKVYNYGSQTMLNLVPIMSLYRDEVGGEINKIKYAVYQAYINSLEGKNTKASDLLKSVEEDLDKMRLKFEKDDDKVKILEKINLSIEDMRKSLSQKSVKLIRIKKDIIINNLEEIEK